MILVFIFLLKIFDYYVNMLFSYLDPAAMQTLLNMSQGVRYKKGDGIVQGQVRKPD